MAEKHSVAMFVTGEDGNRTQVGWASPKDESGIRTFEYLGDYAENRPKNVSFEDDELSQQVAEQQAAAVEADGTDGPEFDPIVEPADDGVVPLPEVPLTVVSNLTEEADVNDNDNDFVAQPEDAEPVDAGVDDEPVELANGGVIVDVNTEDEDEAEFQRLLAEEEANEAADTNTEEFQDQEAPTTRSEYRESQEGA